jgi:phenylacetate-CoA ligase
MSPRLYWNEEIETMPAEALRRLEDGLLPGQLEYVRQASPFYRRKFEAAGADVGAVRAREDLAALPFTEKAELSNLQRDGSLIGDNQCAPLEAIVRVQATGGTTGLPLRLAFTRRDIADYCEMGARALWANGCRPGDIVLECMNYSLYAGGVSDHMCFETVGAATIPYGVGNSQRLLELMAGIRDDLCIWATPSYAIRLANLAAENGVDPKSLGVRRGYFSGEAGLQIPGYRERIESAWGMRARDMYGTGELGLHSGECDHAAGLHYGGAGIVLVELIHPETGQPLAWEEGATGEFVYTSLRREANPLVRMRSRDFVQVWRGACACGRTGFRFQVLGRTDDMFIVKGVNVFPLGVQAVLAALRPRLTGEFQIVLDAPPPIDYAPRLRVEVSPEAPAAGHAALAAEVAEHVRQRSGFTPEVELVPQGAIASEKKTRRLYRAYQGERPE